MTRRSTFVPRPFSVGPFRVRAIPGRGEKDGRWYWRAQSYRGGEETTVWTGWATLEEVTRAVAAFIVDGEKKPTTGVTTVRDLLSYYHGRQEGRSDIKPETAKGLGVMLRRVVEVIGDVQIDRLDGVTLERYRDTRLRNGAATSSVDADIKRVRAAWAWGREVGLVPERSLPKVKCHRQVRVRNDYNPSREEIVAVLAELKGWMRVAVYLYAVTGARLGELAGLRWAQVDLDKGRILVDGKMGKRTIPIRPEAVGVLREWRLERGPAERVWTASESSIRAGLWRNIARACDRAGVPRWSAQGLRRARVDELYRSGADVASAAALAGHSPAIAMRHYRKVSEGDARAAAERGEVLPFPRR